jgi:serine protease inhibitor
MADEEGVIGAAFTVLMAKATAALVEDEPVPFVVDRPFLFCVTARDGSLLFMGIVNTVQAS